MIRCVCKKFASETRFWIGLTLLGVDFHFCVEFRIENRIWFWVIKRRIIFRWRSMFFKRHAPRRQPCVSWCYWFRDVVWRLHLQSIRTIWLSRTSLGSSVPRLVKTMVVLVCLLFFIGLVYKIPESFSRFSPTALGYCCCNHDKIMTIFFDVKMRLSGSGLSGNKARKLYAFNKIPEESFPKLVASHGGLQVSSNGCIC